MYDFMLAGKQVIDLFGFIAGTFNGTACADGIVDGACIVVPELDQYKIAVLQFVENGLP
jgi:hypothetical protein